MTALRLRLAALAAVAALVLAVRALAPDPGMRRAALLLVAVGLGYGHQLGALLFTRRRGRAPLEWLLLASTTLTAGFAFAMALASDAAPGILIGLALLAAWHVLENDVALGRAGQGRMRLPALSQQPRALWLVTLGAAGLVVAAASQAPRLAPWLVSQGVPSWLAAWTSEEVIAALLLYHSAIWLVRGLTTGSAADLPRAVVRRAPILLLHALPLVALVGARELAPAAYAWALSPPVYLFLSAAHALHTGLERGLDAA